MTDWAVAWASLDDRGVLFVAFRRASKRLGIDVWRIRPDAAQRYVLRDRRVPGGVVLDLDRAHAELFCRLNPPPSERRE